jgi:hypothetical protein
MIDRPGLSYGLFHLHAQPIKLYGTITTRVSFQGLNMDIGHLRSLRWSQANDPAAWVTYNRMRGQQASALEHATPEQFWVDRKQCRYTDENGQTVNPTLADCPQAVSAVKALAIAASQGQKIYTITPKNAATALPQLSVSRTVAAEIKNALAAGKEVTVHEKAINAHGFSGVGYILVDPETGAGAYLIEGGGNGGWMTLLAAASVSILSIIVTSTTILISMPYFVALIATVVLSIALAMYYGWDYKAHKPSINMIESITFSTMFASLAKIAGFLGAPLTLPVFLLWLSLVIIVSILAYRYAD